MNFAKIMGAILNFGEQVSDLTERLDGTDNRARQRIRKLSARVGTLVAADVATDSRINSLDERLASLEDIEVVDGTMYDRLAALTVRLSDIEIQLRRIEINIFPSEK